MSNILFVIDEASFFDKQQGRLLSDDVFDTTLSKHGLSRSDIEIVECKNYRRNESNVVVAMGEASLKKVAGKIGLDAYRGSILSGINGEKVIPSYAPYHLKLDPSRYPIFNVDMQRIVEHSHDPNIPELEWDFTYGDDVTEGLIEAYEKSAYLAVDIESVKGTGDIICVGFARGPSSCISITTNKRWIQRLLSCDATKIFHFGTFDKSMLELNGYEIKNYTEDTIVQAHILNPELPRSLGFLTSIYTSIPYYKTEGRLNIPSDTKGWGAKRDKRGLLEYNCKDCCATYSVWLEQRKELEEEPELERLYEYEMELVHVAIAIGSNGLLLDVERHSLLKSALEAKQASLQAALNTICGTTVNINSPKQMQTVLYEGLKLPVRSKSVKEKDGSRTSSTTANSESMISLLAVVKQKLADLKTESYITEWKLKFLFLKLALELRGIEKMLSSYINVQTHAGRVKSMYKVNGTETGRWACSKYVDGSGLNGQTFPRESVEV